MRPRGWIEKGVKQPPNQPAVPQSHGAIPLPPPTYVPTPVTQVRWSREDVQRVLYCIVKSYEQALELGGDSEILRNYIDIGKRTLIDNHWWPED